MRLSSILDDPSGTLRYMEQYINVGSPSGFTPINQPSARYAPGRSPAPFPLLACIGAPESGHHAQDYGLVPNLCPQLQENNWIFIHPDVQRHPELDAEGLSIIEIPKPLVTPTSSGRTVQIISDEPEWHIKLSYPGLLGRVNRSLPQVKAFAGPEISCEVEASILGGSLPPDLHIMREVGARVLTVADNCTWGMVIRDPQPFGPRADQTVAMIPLFSLFSRDAQQPDDPSILLQLISHWGTQADTYVKCNILQAILQCYFSLVATLGLLAELNAQNILLGLNQEGRPTGIVIRDLMGIEKDLTIRDSLGISTHFSSSPYKCISKAADSALYYIRHSFSFDFKLGDYVLSPVIQEACRTGLWEEGALITYVRQVTTGLTDALPPDYFPQDEWYRHPRVLLDKSRPYECERYPRFR